MRILQVTKEECNELMVAMFTTDNRPLAKKLKEQIEDQEDMLAWDEGEREPELQEALWATFDYKDLLLAPTHIGYGTGEELFDSLMTHYNFTYGQATDFLNLLEKLDRED